MSANLAERLLAAAGRRPSAPALILEDRVLSYGDLETGARRAAGRLLQEGLRPGDRLMVQAPKSPESLMLYLGALLAGAVYVPLNTAYTPGEVGSFVEDAKPFRLVADPVAELREAEGAPQLDRGIARAPEDLAALVYTSGTTGRSKGAMLSCAAMLANAEAIGAAWGISEADVLLHALPIYHVHGLFIALHPLLLAGGAMIWREGFQARTALSDLPRASVMMGVPTFYTRLLQEAAFTASVAEPIRLFVSGSAPLTPETFAAFKARTGKRILERYGMSEAGVIASNPLSGERIAGSVGPALGDYQIRIAGGGELGEIEIKGSSLFSGYWERPDATREAFTADGFFRTGDVGRLEADGRLWISDRAKDLVITGGLNVYPREVEMAIDTLPGVVESAVFGAPHPDYGEAVVALVVGEADEAAVVAALRGRLAGFKIPKRVVRADALPRNAMGKVQKVELRRRYRDLFAADGSPLRS